MPTCVRLAVPALYLVCIYTLAPRASFVQPPPDFLVCIAHVAAHSADGVMPGISVG